MLKPICALRSSMKSFNQLSFNVENPVKIAVIWNNL